MTRIALFSDIHVPTNPNLQAYGQRPVENLKAALGELPAFDPERLIITGDCAYRVGRKSNYAAMHEILAPVRDARILIDALAGNHDNRTHLREMLGNPPSPVEGRHVAKIAFPQATWLLLDTQLGVHEVPGCIGVRQRAWIDEELAATPDTSFVVVGHHHPEDPRRNDIYADIGLRDTGEWLDFLDSRPQIKAYLFGHAHSWRHEQTSGGTWLVNLPAVGFVFLENRPRGWVKATMDGDSLKLQLCCADADHPEHGERVEVAL